MRIQNKTNKKKVPLVLAREKKSFRERERRKKNNGERKRESFVVFYGRRKIRIGSSGDLRVQKFYNCFIVLSRRSKNCATCFSLNVKVVRNRNVRSPLPPQ